MPSEVKIFLVEGKMLIRHDRMPEWWRFRKYVRALKPEHAIEKVLSELGSNHKVKRYHVKIERVVEVSPDQVEDRYVLALLQVKRWVKP